MRKPHAKDGKAGGRQAAEQPAEPPPPSTTEAENPLLGPLVEEDGQPCLGGNTTIVHLNLTCEPHCLHWCVYMKTVHYEKKLSPLQDFI